MGKTLLIELTSKQIKLAEGIVLFVLFVSLLAGFGLLSIAVPPGAGIFSSYATVFRRFLSGANLSQVEARESILSLQGYNCLSKIAENSGRCKRENVAVW